MNRKLFAAALLCSVVSATAVLAQDAAAPADAPAAAPAPQGEVTSRWGLVGEAREYMLFTGLDTVTGNPGARTAVSMMVLKETNEQGVKAQQVHYVFNCPRERFYQTGAGFLNEAGQFMGFVPNQTNEIEWDDDKSAEEVGLMVCDRSRAEQSFATVEAAFAYNK